MRSMSLPKIGETVRYIGRKPGERASGDGHEPNVIWLVGGAEGIVVSRRKGYPKHHCPDHAQAPDCVCGDVNNGWIGAMPNWAVVAWSGDREGTTTRRCIEGADEGILWEYAGVNIKEKVKG